MTEPIKKEMIISMSTSPSGGLIWSSFGPAWKKIQTECGSALYGAIVVIETEIKVVQLSLVWL